MSGTDILKDHLNEEDLISSTQPIEEQQPTEEHQPIVDQPIEEQPTKHHVTIIGFDLLAIETAKTAATDGFEVSLFRPQLTDDENDIHPSGHEKCIKEALESLKDIEEINLIEAKSLDLLNGEPGSYKLTFTGENGEFHINTEAIIIEPLTGQVNISNFPEIDCSGNHKVISFHEILAIKAYTAKWNNQENKTILFVTEGGSSKIGLSCNCYNHKDVFKFSNEILSFARENMDVKITVLLNGSFDTLPLSADKIISDQRFSIIEGSLAKIIPEKNGVLALCFDKATSRPLRIKADLIVLNMINGPTIENSLISETVDFTDLNSHNLNDGNAIFCLSPYSKHNSDLISFKKIAQNSLNMVNEFLMRKQQ